ncbi:carbohydrate kinase family protein [Jidongwangia harbinensis]|uniref:carbohydrate kinase family protein n=1 Tax=Jidongwangia harbinensis TaxID=2878561 RepID=UPI002105A706
MRFPGRFAEQLLADRLADVSLSFLVDDLVIRRGGVAANIAYGMSRLGLAPRLVGAAGSDFGDYRSWLESQGIDCSAVLISATRHTARFICTTDEQMCQLASFYPGAMAEALDIDLAAVVRRAGVPDLAVIAPDTPEAMARHADACRRLGVPFAADPSQQVAGMAADDLRRFITGARYLLTNQYEYDLLRHKLAVTEAELAGLVDIVVTTRGSAGVRIRDGAGAVDVPAVPITGAADPTGAGDAFRAGFVTGILSGLSHGTAAAVGCQMAAYALRATGPQEYSVGVPDVCRDLDRAYGTTLSHEVRAALAAPVSR